MTEPCNRHALIFIPCFMEYNGFADDLQNVAYLTNQLSLNLF